MSKYSKTFFESELSSVFSTSDLTVLTIAMHVLKVFEKIAAWFVLLSLKGLKRTVRQDITTTKAVIADNLGKYSAKYVDSMTSITL